MSESSNAGRAGGAPGPSPELRRLGALVGRWRSEGHIVGEVPVSIDVTPVAQPGAAEVSGAVRSTLTISPDRASMTARSERSDDGASWQPWMDMTFARMP